VPATARLLRQLADEGGLRIDVATYPDVLADRQFIEQNVSATYTNRFRVAGAKLTIDGSPQGFTAWRDRPYYAPVGDYPKGYAGLRGGHARAGAGCDRLGLRQEHPAADALQRRARQRSADLGADHRRDEERPGQGPPPGADPRPVPA